MISKRASTKDIERKDRGDDETFEAFSTGAKQKIEENINEFLSNSSFKNGLLNFVYTEYQDPLYAALVGDKEFFCSINDRCMKYYCLDQKLNGSKKYHYFVNS